MCIYLRVCGGGNGVILPAISPYVGCASYNHKSNISSTAEESRFGMSVSGDGVLSSNSNNISDGWLLFGLSL